MSKRIAKKHVVTVATEQSQAAQRVTRGLRAHSWQTRFEPKQTEQGTFASSRAATEEERLDQLRNAVRWARVVVRDAEAVLSWVEAYARQEGAIE